ncbi:histidine phosphatase family protein [Sphingomonas sp. KR1UV-12]|uniref:phosphoglycerate mutase (2,3-diphosphoglycerate-dependent) n=1 Tax=Sphingomonas aurea TaxID=3063994 RepID=A0ABT9EFQ6_9SPHN|nr:histidine phosphatase family protein [Sphingomonas sp. KR1UV-12]MDP1025799.1 histidine phosphatase family protein [Sphingomonas sp. KR1UV-12]
MPKIATLFATLLAAASAMPAQAASFLFIRHAESTANAGTAATPQEALDPPLTALGQQQAIDLAKVLASYNVTSIYTSAYQRTQKTIAPTAALFGLTPTIDARTNEWYYGDAKSLSDVSNAQLYGVIGAWAAGNTAAKTDLPNAESLDDLAARVLPAWQEIIDAHRNDTGTIVIVGHGAETGFVMPYFARNVSSGFAFANGMRNTGIIQVELVGGQPYVTNWQGTALAVPEPASWAMMLTGFGAIGYVMRRRRRVATRVSFA